MAPALGNKAILNNLVGSIAEWTRIAFEDSVSAALGLRETLSEDMVELRRIRWFSMSAAPELDKLWLRYVDRDIENDEAKQSLHDYVMLGTTYMMMQNPLTDEEYNGFIDHMAKSISWPNRATLIPDALREYFGQEEVFKKLLSTNHWLLFLILLSTSDIK